jgi:hypothetical protein
MCTVGQWTSHALAEKQNRHSVYADSQRKKKKKETSYQQKVVGQNAATALANMLVRKSGRHRIKVSTPTWTAGMPTGQGFVKISIR